MKEFIMTAVPERQIRLAPPGHKQEEDSVGFQYTERVSLEKLLRKPAE